jgi:hypothetical protein
MKRAVRAILVLIASALVVFGLMVAGLEYYRHRFQNIPFGLWHGVAAGILIVLGLVLMGFSRSLAEQLTGDFDE